MSPRGRLRRSLSIALAMSLSMGVERVSAQAWTAQLILSPIPSPFLSDWEVDPSIGQLIVTNATSSAASATFHYTLARNGQALLRGTTDPQPVPANSSVEFNATSTFGGRADWNRDIQDLVARTGRLPEGDYEGCVTVAGSGGIVLVERQCVRFTTGYPDPPFLVFPMNGDTVRSQDPIFEWQPVQVSPTADGRIGYVLQIAEVNGRAQQLPEVALQSNILHYVEPGLIQTSHQYPVGALPLVSGRTYAWRVQALDGDGRPVASNQGRSEIWTFVYTEPESEVAATVARVELASRRDTLRFAGDTSRYDVAAYDANNVEIRGRRVQWRALDTTVARVDTAGVVTGAGPGETRIVASVDGVADSALTVTSAQTLIVRFESYDPEGDKPSLLELIKSGSFDEVAPKLMALLQSGEFRIPIPRLSRLLENQGGQGGQEGDRSRQGDGTEAGAANADQNGLPASGGPALDVMQESAARRVADECSDIAASEVSAQFDPLRKVVAIQFTNVEAEFAACVPLPPDSSGAAAGATPDPNFHRKRIFAVSWAHPGVPRVMVAWKNMGDLPVPLNFGGTAITTRYWVLSLTGPISADSAFLPREFNSFFGSESINAGMGLTMHAKRKCVEPEKWLCRMITAINEDNPEIDVHAFLGITAEDMSYGRGGFGASVAAGFSISASLPVRRVGFPVGKLTVDSVQLGLLVAVQDSVNVPLQDSVNVTPKKAENSVSAGLSGFLTTWFTGAGGNSWEFTASVGVEIDPTDLSERPNLVVSGELAQAWKLAYFRVANPMLVITKEIGGQDLTVALSANWGVGPWDGTEAELIGIDTDAVGAGGHRADAGGAGLGANRAFEELGRGTFILKWKKPDTTVTPVADREKERVEEHRMALTAATISAKAATETALQSETQCKTATRIAQRATDGQIPEADRASIIADRDAMCAKAEKDLVAFTKAKRAEQDAEATFQDALKALNASSRPTPAVAPTTSTLTCNGAPVDAGKRCFSWSARVSMDGAAARDLIFLLARLIPGVP